MDQLSQISIKKALRGKFPRAFTYLKTGRRIVSDPLAFGRRTRQAWRMAANSAWRDFIPQEKGFAIFEPDTLPGTDEVVRICRKIFEKRLASRGEKGLSFKKPYLVNIMEEKDLVAHPEILEFVLSDPVVEIAACYLGYVPQLCSVALLVSQVNKTISGSQQFHWDAGDPHHLKCFVHIFDVGPENGPFALVPADKSRWLRTRTNRRWSDAKLTDEAVLEHCDKNDIVSVMGPLGAGVFVDTSRCLHFGSRVASGVRVEFNFHYATFADYSKVGKDERRDIRLQHNPSLRVRFAKDSLRRELLCVPG